MSLLFCVDRDPMNHFGDSFYNVVRYREKQRHIPVRVQTSFFRYLPRDRRNLPFVRHNTNSAFKERRLRENTELSEFVFLRIYNVLYITFTFNDEIRTNCNK